MPDIQLPDGRTVNIPDDASPELISQVQAKIAQDFPELSQGGAPAPQAPSTLQGAGQPTTNNPFQGALQSGLRAVGSLAQTGEDIIDTAQAFPQAFALQRARAQGDDAKALEIAQNNPFNRQGVLQGVAQGANEIADAGPQFQSRANLGSIGAKASKGDVFGTVGETASFVVDNVIANAPVGVLATASPSAAGAIVVDQVANERAQRDGRSQANAKDFLVAGLVAVPSAALSKIGIKPAKARGLKTSFGQVLTAARTEASTEALQGIIEEFASGVGTEEGFTVQDLLSSAGEGALIGAGAATAVGSATQGSIAAQAFTDSQKVGKFSTDRLLAFKQAADLIDEDLATRGLSELSDRRVKVDAARSVAEDQAKAVSALVDELKKNKKLAASPAVQELISDGSLEVPDVDIDADTVFKGRTSPLARALNSKRSFGQPEIDQITALGLDAEVTDSLVQQLTVIDVLSKAGIARNQTGPRARLGAIGSAVTSGLGAAAGLGVGNSLGIPSFLSAPIGAITAQRGVDNAVGSAGRTIDAVTGRSTPDVISQQGAINRVLARRGVEVERPSQALGVAANDAQEVGDLLRDARDGGRQVKPAAAKIKGLRDQLSAENAKARELENKNRVISRQQDPTGRYITRTPGPNGNFSSIDAIAMNDLDEFVRDNFGNNGSRIKGTAKTLGLNVGPAGQSKLLELALRSQNVTASDIELFNTDPKALMTGQRGFFIIKQMKIELDKILRSGEDIPPELRLATYE